MTLSPNNVFFFLKKKVKQVEMVLQISRDNPGMVA